jgi:flagellar assembly protein FliH
MVKPFSISPFSDDEGPREERDSAFVSLFATETNDEDAPPPAVNVEEEARKIFENAYIQGEKAGFEMGMKKVEPLAKRLNNYISAIQAFHEEQAARCEALAVELALIFTRAMVLKECEEDRGILVRMARKALEICDHKNNVVIRMRSADICHISSQSVAPFQVVSDDSLDEPGFLIETDFGDIDGRISTQIEELAKRVISRDIPG